MQPQQQQRGSPPECSTATPSPQHPGGGGKDATPTRAAGAENTSPATLLRAVEQLDAKLRKAVPTSPRSRTTTVSHQPSRGQPQQQQRAAAQQVVLRQRSRAAGGGYGKGSAASGSDVDAAPSDSIPVPGAEGQHTAAAATPPAADALEQLLLELMAAEGVGDPYSIINLYVAEQLALQQAAEAEPAASAAPAAPAAPVSGLPLASSQPAHATGQAVAALATAQAACCGHSPRAVEAAAACVAMVEEVQLPHAPPPGLRDPSWKDLLLPVKEQPPPLREQPSLKPQPNESAPSSARHRRSSSLMLPPQFDVAAAAEPAEWSIAAFAVGGAGLPEGASRGTGTAAGTLATELPPQPSAIQRQQSADVADKAPLEQQQGGSKQLYVQQWLQRSAAELAASESAPACSSAGYSEDPDQASAQLDALSSQASPEAGMALPPGGVAPSPAAAAAATPPEAAAAAAPSGVSASSRSASAVTSMRRPSAPEPPSSSSQLDSSSLAPSRSRAVVAPAVQAAPPALMALLDVEQTQAPVAEQPACSSSSWDGRSGVESELQAALSFGQLEAVGLVDAEAVLQARGAAAVQEAAEECKESLHSPSSHSNSVHSARKYATLPAVAAAAAPGVSIAAAAAGRQVSGTPSSEAYSSDFDSDFEDAEISYGDLGAGSSPAPAVVDAAAAAACDWHTAATAAAAAAVAAAGAAALGRSVVEISSRPSSPRMVQPALWQVGGGSPPGSAGSQQRPRSPHPAALDDRYPGSPPASGGSPSPQLPVPGATYSRPHSPASRGDSPRASDDGAVTYPGSAAACNSAAAAAAVDDSLELSALKQEDTVVVHSPTRSSSGSGGSGDGQAGSPYSLVQFGTEPADVVAAEYEVTAAAAAAAVAAAGPALGGVGSPPGTPVVASPGDDHGSCPGSARVEDDTVVQTGAAG